MSIIKELRYSLSQKSLITIKKSFLRPPIDYGDIINDQPQNDSFYEKLESIQYKAALAITGAIQGTSCDTSYQELEFQPLKSRRWYKRLCLTFDIMKEEDPNYLINLIPKCEQTIRTRNNRILVYCCRTESFKHSFFSLHLKKLVQLRRHYKKF